jgi:hypothetical protein
MANIDDLVDEESIRLLNASSDIIYKNDDRERLMARIDHLFQVKGYRIIERIRLETELYLLSLDQRIQFQKQQRLDREREMKRGYFFRKK